MPFKSVAGLPEPNQAQKEAFAMATKRPIAVIEAPPGTGKTTVAAMLAYLFAKSDQRVLVCAPSNIAVDNLTIALAKTDLKNQVLRVYSAKKDNELAILPADEAVCAMSLRNAVNEENKVDATTRRQEEIACVARASVICCTCVMAGDERLQDGRFDAVIIDEATQAGEPQALIPIAHFTKRLVLVGDSKQLGPTIFSQRVKNAKFDLSLFERLTKIHETTVLKIQYRMHPEICAFPNNQFYNNDIVNGVGEKERTIRFKGDSSLVWPIKGQPTVLISTRANHNEELAGLGNTFVNRDEAKMLLFVLHKLFDLGIEPKKISVITMYEGQRAYLRSFMNHLKTATPREAKARSPVKSPENSDDGGESLTCYMSDEEDAWQRKSRASTSTAASCDVMTYSELVANAKCKRIQIDTVDAFQGRENDVVRVSTVRSNRWGRLGFLWEPRRLNVALTRAKKGLIILADQKTLQNSETWTDVIDWYKNRKTIRL